MNLENPCELAAAPVGQSIAWPAERAGQIGAETVAPAELQAPEPLPDRELHCLADVRRRQRVSVRKAARLLGITAEEVRWQEHPSADILLSDLYRWREILNVPVTELLEQADGELSPPVRLRARLVRAMKSVRSMQEVARQPSVRRLAENLAAQLIEIMPELKEAVAWPVVGSRRLRGDFGQAFLRGFMVCTVEPDCEFKRT